MRISKVLGLQWEDIDWDAQIIHLNRTWVYVNPTNHRAAARATLFGLSVDGHDCNDDGRELRRYRSRSAEAEFRAP